MTLEVVAFAAGCLLIITAIVGGGLEIKEIKMPRVGAAGRVACTCVGLFFLALGLGIAENNRALTVDASTVAQTLTQSGPAAQAQPQASAEPAVQEPPATEARFAEPEPEAPSFGGMQAQGRISWIIDGAQYTGDLYLQGTQGMLRVQFPVEGGVAQVDQDLVLEEQDGRFFYQGTNPRYSADQTPTGEGYRPDRLRLAEVQANAWSVTEACDADRCVAAAMEWNGQ
jgi:hypothetical protein